MDHSYDLFQKIGSIVGSAAVQIEFVSDCGIWIVDPHSAVFFICAVADLREHIRGCCTFLGQDMRHTLQSGCQKIHIQGILVFVRLRYIDHRQAVAAFSAHQFPEDLGICGIDHTWCAHDRKVAVIFQIFPVDQKGDKIRCGEFGILHQRIRCIAPLQANGHFHVVEIHDIFCIPDHAVVFPLLITDSDDILFFLLLDIHPQMIISEADIPLTVPFQIRNHVHGIRTFLIPLDHKTDEIIRCQCIPDWE